MRHHRSWASWACLLVLPSAAACGLDVMETDTESGANESELQGLHERSCRGRRCAGVLVSLPDGTLTSEQGDSIRIFVSLATRPKGKVTVSALSNDPSEGRTGAAVVFGPDNWDQPQAITVTGQDDEIVDGEQPYQIKFRVVAPRDRSYHRLHVRKLTLTNQDDDDPRLVASPRGELVTDEHGGEVTIDVSLGAPPTATVQVLAQVSDTTEAVASPESLLFTPENWATPQPVTVRGVSDLLADGTVAYEVRLIPVSEDPAYGELSPPALTLENDDGTAFSGIGDLVGGAFSSIALDVNAVGDVVVGYGEGGSGKQALRWTPGGGSAPLAGTNSEARAVNALGDVIAGVAANAPGQGRAVVWTDGVGPSFLAFPDAVLISSSTALGISGDGTVVTGSAYQVSAGPAGTLWEDGALTHLGYPYSYITAANADGSVLVGYHVRGRYASDNVALYNGAPLPFPQDPECEDYTCLCLTPAVSCAGYAHDVSADGAIVVGSGWLASAGMRAGMWAVHEDGTIETTMLELSAEALGVSHDGKVVVGYREEAGAQFATRWSEDGTSRGIAELLTESGLDLDGWALTVAHAASADGRVIIGEGINPSGAPEGWIAVLPFPPAPPPGAAVALAD